MKEADSSADLVRKARLNLEFCDDRDATIGMAQLKADIYLVSDIKSEPVRPIFYTLFETVQSAVDNSISRIGEKVKNIAMQYVESAIPFLCNIRIKRYSEVQVVK